MGRVLGLETLTIALVLVLALDVVPWAIAFSHHHHPHHKKGKHGRLKDHANSHANMQVVRKLSFAKSHGEASNQSYGELVVARGVPRSKIFVITGEPDPDRSIDTIKGISNGDIGRTIASQSIENKMKGSLKEEDDDRASMEVAEHGFTSLHKNKKKIKEETMKALKENLTRDSQKEHK
ncbi:hypothetical protein GOP47_0005313 [Adiantum capillus-veneris]|uniref:Uncharacterized protein n=1 Tax=Adiantum capillus-veneris TaxID=13818 RepID=A0A9D4V5B1_ADICA|nr:hypothetical protein GOP47_0005313 [Adiantum capillus-veneris]